MHFKYREFGDYLFTNLDDRIFTGLLLGIVAVLLTVSGELIRFDNLYYDLGRYLTFKSAPTDIVIVAIDEASLEQIGRWPWSRIVHAELVNKLKLEHASVIGLDIIFAEPEANNPNADSMLASSIKQANNVVLPIVLEVPFIGSPIKQSIPLASFATSAAALGRVHVPLDTDGIARSVYLWEGLSSDGFSAYGLPLFAQSVLQVAKLLPRSFEVRPPVLKFPELSDSIYVGLNQGRLIRQELRKVNFSGSPGHFQRISYSKVLSGEYPAHFFKNKIVLVGATAIGLGDALSTPASASSQPMPGVEIHANVIESMRNSNLVIETPLWVTCLFCITLALAPLIWMPKLTPLKSLLVIIAYFFVVIGIVVSMPHFFNLWIPPSGGLFTILLAYPIWSWRKLDSTQIFLDAELESLRNDLLMLGVDEANFILNTNEDQFQTRISKVKLTAKHLRDLYRDRNDTLAFISHDIRAPLGTAIMLLKEPENTKYLVRIIQMLDRTFNMAESFLQVSRAEMVETNKFQELDLVRVVQQALDDSYESAEAKKVALETDIPDAGLWIKGDLGLIQRAVLNILLNAIKYSSDKSIVRIVIEYNSHEVVLRISDNGQGFSSEMIPKLFKRFSRLDIDYQSSEGSGLGLYFVDTVIKKHQGTVLVESEVGRGSTFIITLPIVNMTENEMVGRDSLVTTGHKI